MGAGAAAAVETESWDELSDSPTGDGVREKLVITCVGLPQPGAGLSISTITTGVATAAAAAAVGFEDRRFSVTVRLHTAAAADTAAGGRRSMALSDSADAYALQLPGPPVVPSDSNTHDRP